MYKLLGSTLYTTESWTANAPVSLAAQQTDEDVTVGNLMYADISSGFIFLYMTVCTQHTNTQYHKLYHPHKYQSISGLAMRWYVNEGDRASPGSTQWLQFSKLGLNMNTRYSQLLGEEREGRTIPAK